jgi:hypothetical protein
MAPRARFFEADGRPWAVNCQGRTPPCETAGSLTSSGPEAGARASRRPRLRDLGRGTVSAPTITTPHERAPRWTGHDTI